MVPDERQFRSLSRDERRDRIVWAAKLVLLEKGLDAASMDDVAARAGTTKPTVYAHFKSKDELFRAVVELIKGLFLGKLRSPDVYAAEPVEAVALFCGRFVELVCWRDAVGYQRVALAAAAQISRDRQGGLRHCVRRGLPVPGRLPAHPQADPKPRAGRRTAPVGDDRRAGDPPPLRGGRPVRGRSGR